MCLICGMMLELEVVIVDMGLRVDFVDMMCWFWIGFVLMLFVFVLEMGGYFMNLYMLFGVKFLNWI